jgi:heme/copper-type cytochrome/quinol oxidase subunit 2
VPFTIWVRLIVWFVVGMVVYIGYGVRRSKLAQPPPRA